MKDQDNELAREAELMQTRAIVDDLALKAAYVSDTLLMAMGALAFAVVLVAVVSVTSFKP